MKEKDWNLGFKNYWTTIGNPDMDIKTIKMAVSRLALCQTRIKSQTNSISQMSDSRTFGSNNRQLFQYIFNARPNNLDSQNNRKLPQNNDLPTPNTVQFIDDQDRNVMNDFFSTTEPDTKRPIFSISEIVPIPLSSVLPTGH